MPTNYAELLTTLSTKNKARAEKYIRSLGGEIDELPPEQLAKAVAYVMLLAEGERQGLR